MPRDKDNLRRWAKDNHAKRWATDVQYRERRRAESKRNRIAYDKYGKAWHLRNTYGLSVQQFNEMVEAQKGLCAICAEVMTPGRVTHVDHCHITRKIRKLLCSRCNQALGLLREDVSIIKSALDYLEAHNG